MRDRRFGYLAPRAETVEWALLLRGWTDDVVVFTHLWWTARGPAEDPYAPDPAVLHASRARVLALADVIVPGHGAPFTPTDATPR